MNKGHTKKQEERKIFEYGISKVCFNMVFKHLCIINSSVVLLLILLIMAVARDQLKMGSYYRHRVVDMTKHRQCREKKNLAAK